MSHKAFIGIGSNLGPATKNCLEAIEQIESHPRIKLSQQSSFYETEPVGPKDQNWFINAVVMVQTPLGERELFEVLQSIERKMGRIRRDKWGPRIIDLDLLFYDNVVIQTEELTLPHPEISQRRFVLAPMAEIAAEHRHPLLGKSIREMLEAVPPTPAVHPVP